jgi:hypothetical protein
MNESILTYNYQGKIDIFFLKSDELYLNATETARKFGKDVREWKRAKQTTDYIEALADVENLHIEKLIIIRKGGNNKNSQGTWIHKKLIISFARWLDVKFAVWCDLTIEEILKTGSYSLQKEEKSEYDFEEIQKVVKIGTELLSDLKNLNPVEQIKLDTFVKNRTEKSLLEDFGISFENSYFLPTEIGNMFGVSGAEVNLILEKKGFQFRDENGIWRPTEKGFDFCLEIGNKFNQLKWKLQIFLQD